MDFVFQSLQGTYPTVFQIDLVPTIASLLGVPIPFGNLGTVILDLFPEKHDLVHSPGQEREQLLLQQLANAMQRTSALHANAYQVDKYLSSYARVSAEMSQDTLFALSQQLQYINMNMSELKTTFRTHSNKGHFRADGNNSDYLAVLVKKLVAIENSYINYLSQVKSLCQRLWVTFDMLSIGCGVLILLTNLLTVFLLTLEPSVFFNFHAFPIVKASVVCFLGAMLLTSLPCNIGLPFYFVVLIMLAIGSNIGFLFTVFRARTITNQITSYKFDLTKTATPENIAASVICILYASALFSNSFVVNEDKMVSFFVQSLVTVLIGVIVWKRSVSSSKILRTTHKKIKEEVKATKSSMPTLWLLVVAVVFEVSGRFALVFKACREEQHTCQPSSFLQPLSALTDPSATANHRFMLTVLSVCILPFGLQCWLRYRGNLNGSSPTVLCIKYALPSGAILMCAHWALQIVPQNMNKTFPHISLWQQIILPQLVYWACLITIVLLLWKPLCAYVVFQNRKSALESHVTTENLDLKMVQILFQEMKATWRKEENQVEDVPLVYGLATIYSSALLVLSTAVLLPIVMVLGDGLAPSVLLLILQMLSLLEIYRCNCSVQSRTAEYEGGCLTDSVNNVIAMFRVMSPFVINVPTRDLLIGSSHKAVFSN